MGRNSRSRKHGITGIRDAAALQAVELFLQRRELFLRRQFLAHPAPWGVGKQERLNEVIRCDRIPQMCLKAPDAQPGGIHSDGRIPEEASRRFPENPMKRNS